MVDARTILGVRCALVGVLVDLSPGAISARAHDDRRLRACSRSRAPAHSAGQHVAIHVTASPKYPRRLRISRNDYRRGYDAR
jgi:hypothetical protein